MKNVTTKFAVFNPLTGIYEYSNTIQDAIDVFTSIFLEQIMEFKRRAPIAVVEINEHGHEIWKNCDQTVIPNGAEELVSQALVKSKYKWLDDPVS